MFTKTEWVLERYRYTEGREYRILTTTTTFTDENEARAAFAQVALQDKTDCVFLSTRVTTEDTVETSMGVDRPAGAVMS